MNELIVVSIAVKFNVQRLEANYAKTSTLDTDQCQWRIQDFPEEGAPTLGGHQDTILLKFPENSMKLKKIRSGGGRVPCAPLKSATACISFEKWNVLLTLRWWLGRLSQRVPTPTSLWSDPSLLWTNYTRRWATSKSRKSFSFQLEFLVRLCFPKPCEDFLTFVIGTVAVSGVFPRRGGRQPRVRPPLDPPLAFITEGSRKSSSLANTEHVESVLIWTPWFYFLSEK